MLPIHAYLLSTIFVESIEFSRKKSTWLIYLKSFLSMVFITLLPFLIENLKSDLLSKKTEDKKLIVLTGILNSPE